FESRHLLDPVQPGQPLQEPFQADELVGEMGLARHRVIVGAQVSPGTKFLPFVEQGKADLAGRPEVIRRRVSPELVHEATEDSGTRLRHGPQAGCEGFGDFKNLLAKLDLALRLAIRREKRTRPRYRDVEIRSVTAGPEQ